MSVELPRSPLRLTPIDWEHALPVSRLLLAPVQSLETLSEREVSPWVWAPELFSWLSLLLAEASWMLVSAEEELAFAPRSHLHLGWVLPECPASAPGADHPRQRDLRQWDRFVSP
jgi:hypothetical protein